MLLRALSVATRISNRELKQRRDMSVQVVRVGRYVGISNRELKPAHCLELTPLFVGCCISNRELKQHFTQVKREDPLIHVGISNRELKLRSGGVVKPPREVCISNRELKLNYVLIELVLYFMKRISNRELKLPLQFRLLRSPRLSSHLKQRIETKVLCLRMGRKRGVCISNRELKRRHRRPDAHVGYAGASQTEN